MRAIIIRTFMDSNLAIFFPDKKGMIAIGAEILRFRFAIFTVNAKSAITYFAFKL